MVEVEVRAHHVGDVCGSHAGRSKPLEKRRRETIAGSKVRPVLVIAVARIHLAVDHRRNIGEEGRGIEPRLRFVHGDEPDITEPDSLRSGSAGYSMISHAAPRSSSNVAR